MIVFPYLFFFLLAAVLLSIETASAAAVRFVEVTREAGVDFTYVNGASGHKYMPEPMGSGAAFFDYDDDGFLDLYIVNGTYLDRDPGDDPPTNALYRNDGDGTFTNVTDAMGAGDAGWGTNAAFVDYDNDGDLDLYVANYMDFRIENNRECRQSTARAYCGPTAYPGQSGVLYRNDGNAPLVDVTEAAGLSSTAGRQLGATFGDYDDDGDLDLFVANDKTPNFLFRNNGDGTFTETGAIAGIAYNEDGLAESAMGADWGDYDSDGRLDIIVATFQWLANTLYHNDGDGFFTDLTYAAQVGKESLPYLGMTAAFMDYDSDGYLDLFVANGHLDENVEEYDTAAAYAQKNQLFRNDGDGTFAEVTHQTGPGLQVERVSHGAAFGDLDNDGDVDVFVSDSDTPHCTLLRNDGGNQNRYLMIRTKGTRSNRDGIGARLRVVAGDLAQVKEVRSTYGYLSANDLRVHFGLGRRPQADRVEVRWPSGVVQVLEDVAVDQLLTIEEPLP